MLYNSFHNVALYEIKYTQHKPDFDHPLSKMKKNFRLGHLMRDRSCK